VSFLFALSLAASTAGAAPADYPATAMIGAFKELCADPSSIEAVRAAARTSGWQEFTPEPASNLGKLFVTGKSMVADLTAKGEKVDLAPFVAFRKTVAGRSVEASADAATTTASGKTVTVTGCQTYDFSAPAIIDDATLTAWVGRAPDKKVDYTGQLTAISWETGLTGPGSKLAIAFAPSTSPLANPSRLMVLGLVIKSQHFTVKP